MTQETLNRGSRGRRPESRQAGFTLVVAVIFLSVLTILMQSSSLAEATITTSLLIDITLTFPPLWSIWRPIRFMRPGALVITAFLSWP